MTSAFRRTVTSERRSAQPAPVASPRLYDLYLLLDVLHVYDALGAARARTFGGTMVFDGPPLEDVAKLDRAVLETLPFAYDAEAGGWCFRPRPRHGENGA